jgi:hypothetical protein
MSAAAIFGAVMSSIFVAALWFNYHGPIPPQDSSEQKDKTQQTDEKSKDKSEQQEKPRQKGKSSTKSRQRSAPRPVSRIAPMNGRSVL